MLLRSSAEPLCNPVALLGLLPGPLARAWNFVPNLGAFVASKSYCWMPHVLKDMHTYQNCRIRPKNRKLEVPPSSKCLPLPLFLS